MNKEEFKKYLEEKKYTPSNIEEISSYVDGEKDIESLYEKIKFLQLNGVSNNGVELIVSENPLFLTVPLETVKNSINFLKNIKLDDIAKVVEINSELLSTSDKTLGENFRLLKILIPEKELLNTLKIDAEILSFNTNYLEKRLEFLIKLGFKNNIKSIILNYFDAFEDDEEEIDVETIKDYINK